MNGVLELFQDRGVGESVAVPRVATCLGSAELGNWTTQSCPLANFFLILISESVGWSAFYFLLYWSAY